MPLASRSHLVTSAGGGADGRDVADVADDGDAAGPAPTAVFWYRRGSAEHSPLDAEKDRNLLSELEASGYGDAARMLSA